MQWWDEKYFALVDAPSSVLNLGPNYAHYDSKYGNLRWNPWISTSQIGYYKIGNYYEEQANYDSRQLNKNMMPGVIDSPLVYTPNGPDGYLYIPVDPDLVVDGNVLVDPESLPYDVEDINDLIDSDYTDIQNIEVPDITGIPTDFDPGYTPDDNPGTDPGTNPVPEEPEPYPETPPNGNVGEWLLSIPILGDILRVLIDILNAVKRGINIIIDFVLEWLEKIWSMLKSIFDLLDNFFSSASSGGDGIDWGNFKGLFDIFYIFYYLIIIIIMILLKFLAVVWNMLSIPANSALFASYPTLLAGLNYIKNIKVGGFNITLFQVFEYMFTVFFFLFVVTVLQKLYHSFQGVERQQLREQNRKERN